MKRRYTIDNIPISIPGLSNLLNTNIHLDQKNKSRVCSQKECDSIKKYLRTLEIKFENGTKMVQVNDFNLDTYAKNFTIDKVVKVEKFPEKSLESLSEDKLTYLDSRNLIGYFKYSGIPGYFCNPEEFSKYFNIKMVNKEDEKKFFFIKLIKKECVDNSIIYCPLIVGKSSIKTSGFKDFNFCSLTDLKITRSKERIFNSEYTTPARTLLFLDEEGWEIAKDIVFIIDIGKFYNSNNKSNYFTSDKEVINNIENDITEKYNLFQS